MSNSKTIPVRMPAELYDAVIASKPAEVRVSTYLLMLVRRGLNAGVENFSTNVETSPQHVDNSRESVDNTLISSLQSQIADLEERLGGTTKALLSIDATVQKAVDNYAQTIDKRIQEGIQHQMGEVLGESRA